MTKPRYIIGIDLGTTNCVVAYTATELEKGKFPDIKIMQIPQLVGAGVVEKRPVLPSFILIPREHEIPDDALKLPWKEDNRIAVGEFARDRGAEIPHRLISSAKSWLCNTMVDRNAAILPWSDAPRKPDDDNADERLSPVEASAAILRHIRNAWNYTMAETEEAKLEHQDVIITVPASFDAVARELTVKAAEMAGLTDVTLIEEPLSAFYAWLESTQDEWRQSVSKDDLVLVCDVGGGTSDFSLIQIAEEGGELVLERIAVGDHLLVGGDNMDLALSYAVYHEMKAKGTKLDNWQMRGLIQSCRKAKEKILSDPKCNEHPVTILGRGSSLIGGTIKTMLQKEKVEQVIRDGFFPICKRADKPVQNQQSGIREIGLVYEADPAVTRHIAQFLRRKSSDDKTVQLSPTAVLFNGGIMKAASLRSRILYLIESWRETAEGVVVSEIENDDYDLAVARGAAYYGQVRRGGGIRIRAGLGKSYYIGVAVARPAVPGMPPAMKALCVAPFGMEEGSQATLSDQEFVLVVGEPVKFDFLTSSQRFDDKAGTVVEDWEENIEALTTLETTLDGKQGEVIPVSLETKATETGALAIRCVARDDDRKWKLAFNVRGGD